VDSEVLWSEADVLFLKKRGIRPGAEIKSLVMGTTLLESAAAMKRTYGLAGSAERIAADRLAMVSALYRDRLEPRPGARGALERLAASGLRLALATASPRSLVAITFERLPWEGFFGAVVTGDEVARGKPAPDLFLLAARRLGVPPEACVVVEDAPAGVGAARAAGMRSVGVPDPRYHRPHELPADLVLTRLDELGPDDVHRLLDGV
jgi:HAD superfamily hydrolase (TIGR01509 family)